MHDRYTPTAVILHWAIALLVLVALPLGMVMTELPLSPTKLELYSYHKWIGITVLALAGFRLVWRLTHTPPPLPADLPAWQRRASRLVHGALYGLILAVPLSGWLMSSAKGFQTVWFGILPLPDLVAKDRALGELLADLHTGLNAILASLVVLHIAAALKHHFVERRPFLQRMGFARHT